MIERRSDDVVERLLGAAEPGPAIPAGAADRLKAVLRPEWRRQVRRRSIGRLTTMAAGLAAAAMLVILALPEVEPVSPLPAPAASLEAVMGNVTLRSEGGSARVLRPLDAGRMITARTRLTTDAAQRAALRMANGASLRVDQSTAVEVVSGSEVNLIAGGVYVDAGSTAAPLIVHTPFGSARDVGTQFEVRVGRSELLVRVREGVVVVNRGASERRVLAGTELSAGLEGDRTRAVPPDSPVWDWAWSAAPPIAIEGRPVAELVGRLSRESGVPVRYADAESAQIAATSLLHGSVGPLRPLEILEAVLPAAGLEARRDAGTLVIGRAGARDRPDQARPSTRR